MGDRKGAYRILVGKPVGKRPLGRTRASWEDNIKMDLQEVGLEWIDLAENMNRWQVLVNAVMNIRLP
jgi:hypothetical protein